MGLSILKTLKSPIFWAKFAGIFIPSCFFLYVIYLNILPFGYDKTFIITVGSSSDTKPSTFYLEPSRDLSETKTDESGKTYRELNGLAKAVFRPDASLANATLSIEILGGEDVALVPTSLNFDTSSVEWDYNWDIKKTVPEIFINKNVFSFEESPYFDETASLELPDSFDQFENGAFTIYAEWTPNEPSNNFQEIVGHYNWELLQEKNKVRFMIGRVNDNLGEFHNVEYLIDKPQDFFNKDHTVIAVYSPDPQGGRGYIDLYVDGIFADRTPIGKDVIWKDYNESKNLTIGKSQHGSATYYSGRISQIRIKNAVAIPKVTKFSFQSTINGIIKFPLMSSTTTTVQSLKLHVEK